METILIELTSALLIWIAAQIFTIERYKHSDPLKSRDAAINFNFLMNCKIARVFYLMLAIFIFLLCLTVGVYITSLPNPIHNGYIYYSKFWGVLIVALSSVPVWKMVQIAYE